MLISHVSNILFPSRLLPMQNPIRMELLSLISCILFLSNVEDSSSVGLEVTTKLGEILGKVGLSRNGREYYSFLGIPYGRVPQRFMESVPAAPWEGLRDATMFGPNCLNSDDCLSINVYIPILASNATQELPAMFWIHGGGYQFGSGADYGPDYFMDEDIVLVTMNYRLGVLGFFTLDIDGAPGNQGMKDLVLALKWTQDNIENFGGDKNRVTIFGESAGGAAVSLLVLSPLTKGLFHGAMSQSGTALCPWAFRTDVKIESLKLATRLGCEGTDEEILDCMKRIGAYQLWMARGVSFLPESVVKPMSFIPTIERRAPSNKSTLFMPNSPLQMFRTGDFQPVPYMLGNTKYEMGVASFLCNKSRHEDYIQFSPEYNAISTRNPKSVLAIASMGFFSNQTVKDYISYVAPTLFGYADRADARRVTVGMQKTYFEDLDDSDTDFVLSKLSNDRFFFAPTRISALYHSTLSPTYLYMFDKSGYAAMVPFVSQSTPQHTDELQYLFPLSKPPYWGSFPIPKEHSMYEFSAELVRFWVAFAKERKPAGHWKSKEIQWNEIDESPQWLHINDECAFEEENTSFQRRMSFWSKFYNA